MATLEYSHSSLRCRVHNGLSWMAGMACELLSLRPLDRCKAKHGLRVGLSEGMLFSSRLVASEQWPMDELGCL